MAIKLEFIGCGAGFSVGLGNNNAMIYDDTPENGYWLIDCGETTRVNLVERKLIDKCKGVIVTHLHGDHIYGLEMLGFWWHFVKHKRLRLMLPSLNMATNLASILGGTMSELQTDLGDPYTASFNDFFSPMVYTLGDYMELVFSSGKVKIDFFRTDHVPNKESCGVNITVGDKKHIFTSDTHAVQIQRTNGYIWHDCQLYDGGLGGVHTFIGKLKTWTLRDEPDPRLHLMHYNRQPTPEEIADALTWCGGFVTPGKVFEL